MKDIGVTVGGWNKQLGDVVDKGRITSRHSFHRIFSLPLPFSLSLHCMFVQQCKQSLTHDHAFLSLNGGVIPYQSSLALQPYALLIFRYPLALTCLFLSCISPFSGWFGASELKSFDPASAEKTRSSLKKGSGLRTALSEALDPSLVAHKKSTELDLDEYDEEDQDDHKQTGAAKRKAPPKTKKVSPKNDQAASEKRRRPSTTEEPSKRKVVKRTTDSQLSDDEDTSKVFITQPNETSSTLVLNTSGTITDMLPLPFSPSLPQLKQRSSITSRSRLESDLKSVDDDISIGDASNGHTKRSEDDPMDSGDPTRAKKRIRSMQTWIVMVYDYNVDHTYWYSHIHLVENWNRWPAQ